MSFCCKLAPNDHEDTCAFNPKNFESAPEPDAGEPKAAAERKMIDAEKLRAFAKDLEAFQAGAFSRSKSEDE